MDLANVSRMVLGLFLRITLANNQDPNHELFTRFVQGPHDWSFKAIVLAAIVFFLFLAVLTPECFAENPLSDEEYRALRLKKDKSVEDFTVFFREHKYRVWRPVIGVFPQVLLEGSAEKLLDYKSLNDYLALRFANDLKDYNKDTGTLDETGWFTCYVWTVAEKYPIALHIKCRATVSDKGEDWSNEFLAIQTEHSLKERVKTTLSDFTQQFAVFFLKAKGIL